jgi:hypothetical protein
MKKIVTVVFILLSTILNAQSNWETKQDSLDFHECIKMMTELFEGRLIKNGNIQKNLVPYIYYWGRCCKEGTLEDYPSFEISYRNHLNAELRKNLNEVDKVFKKKIDDNGIEIIKIVFYGLYTHGPRTGERISISLEFYKKDGVMNFNAIEIPSRISE